MQRNQDYLFSESVFNFLEAFISPPQFQFPLVSNRKAGKILLNSFFMNYLTVAFGVALLVVHIPAKRHKKGVNKIVAGECFVVFRLFIRLLLRFKAFDEFRNLFVGGFFFVIFFGKNIFPKIRF